MIRPRSTTGLAAGSALILVVNAVILGAAAYNRRGEPLLLTLTERELALPEFREDEGSGLFLSFRSFGQAPRGVDRVAWRRGYELPPVEYPWLDERKMRALGLRLDTGAGGPVDESRRTTARARRALVALEVDGEGWSRLMAAREDRVAGLRKDVEAGRAAAEMSSDAEVLLELDRAMRSRLVPIDADQDREALRRRHEDRHDLVVVEALVDAVRDATGLCGPVWRGRVTYLLLADVRVPADLRHALAPFLPKETADEAAKRDRAQRTHAWPAANPPRYRAVVAIGRRAEPWLVSVTPVDQDAGNQRMVPR